MPCLPINSTMRHITPVVTIILSLSSAGWGQTSAHTPHLPNTSNGMVLYGAEGFVPPSLWSQLNTWMGQHFDLVLGGNGDGDVHGGHSTNLYWAAYTDIGRDWVKYTMQSAGDYYGYDWEKSLLHSSIDMQWSADKPFADTDKFDVFEATWMGNRVGGLFTYSGGTYADVTAASWNSAPTAITSTLYVGYMVPFDQLNFTIATPRSGGTVAYNYWNGSAWAPVSSHFTDGTSGLTATGQVYFYPPSDWTRRTLPVNLAAPPITNTNSKYWIQVVVTGATTAPVFTSLRGENWSVASGANNARGWNATDAHRINVGTPLEYNPTPPSNATAKFRYQSRVPAYGNSYIYGNPSNVQNGSRTWGKWLVYSTDAQTDAGDPYDAAFFDDGGLTPAPPISPSGNYLQYFDYNYAYNSDANYADNFTAEQYAAYVQAINDLKAEHGAHFWVGTNNPIPGYPAGAPAAGDYTLIEGYVVPNWQGQPYCDYSVTGTCPYDWAAQGPTNPNNVKFYWQVNDCWSLLCPKGPTGLVPYWSFWHPMDNGNRSPMMTLAMHYLGWNSNSGFMYFGGDSYNLNFYSETDEVYTYGPATAITNSVSADSAETQKTINVASTAGCSGTGSSPWRDMILYLGTPGATGEPLQGKFGRVFYASGNEITSQMRMGDATGKLFNQDPIQFNFANTSTFSSVTMTFNTFEDGSVTPVWTYWNGSAWAPLTVTDGTNKWTQNGTVTWTPPSDWASTTLYGYSGYFVGVSMQSAAINILTAYSSDWKTFDTTSNVLNPAGYSSGTSAYCVNRQHQATASPSVNHVFAWTRWFPAMATDLGVPNTSGLNGGARMIPWKTGGAPDNVSGLPSCTGGCSDVWRRDFTKAIVLFRPYRWGGVMQEAELDTYSKPIDLGGTYYPLGADGTTGAGVTSVTLRGGEGAILMTEPSGTDPGITNPTGAIIRGRIRGGVMR